jgi:hypothetical protein
MILASREELIWPKVFWLRFVLGLNLMRLFVRFPSS